MLPSLNKKPKELLMGLFYFTGARGKLLPGKQKVLEIWQISPGQIITYRRLQQDPE